MAERRRTMSGLRVDNAETWGTNKAVERYGKPQYLHGAPPPKDQSRPQDPMDKQDKGYRNEVPVSSWLRGGNESGKPKR
jgi:hypothetical protein